MFSPETPYIATSEDFLFIYDLLDREYYPDTKMLRIFKIWDREQGGLHFNKNTSKHTIKNFLSHDGITKFISNKCINPPIINFNDEAFWSMIFFLSKDFMFNLHSYLKTKGFDLMERFSKLASTKNTEYKFWCILPNYISYINKGKADHQPSPENVFKAIEWLSDIKKKYCCNAILSFLTYAALRPQVYDVRKTIDLFVGFTEKQKSIPKNQIKKYEDLMKNLESLDKDYWELQVANNSELKSRILKKQSSYYEVFDKFDDLQISRKWDFDTHNLSIKNNNFNVKTMKDNFDKLHRAISNHFVDSSEVAHLNYRNINAIITIELVIKDSIPGKTELANLQRIIDMVYGCCLKNNPLNINELIKVWQNILLADKLEKSLVSKEKNIKKISKI